MKLTVKQARIQPTAVAIYKSLSEPCINAGSRRFDAIDNRSSTRCTVLRQTPTNKAIRSWFSPWVGFQPQNFHPRLQHQQIGVVKSLPQKQSTLLVGEFK